MASLTFGVRLAVALRTRGKFQRPGSNWPNPRSQSTMVAADEDPLRRRAVGPNSDSARAQSPEQCTIPIASSPDRRNPPGESANRRLSMRLRRRKVLFEPYGDRSPDAAPLRRRSLDNVRNCWHSTVDSTGDPPGDRRLGEAGPVGASRGPTARRFRLLSMDLPAVARSRFGELPEHRVEVPPRAPAPSPRSSAAAARLPGRPLVPEGAPPRAPVAEEPPTITTAFVHHRAHLLCPLEFKIQERPRPKCSTIGAEGLSFPGSEWSRAFPLRYGSRNSMEISIVP